MRDYLLILPVAISFLITLFTLPGWIRRAKNAGLTGKDIHKFKSTDVAEAGGVTVAAGAILGVLVYIAYLTFRVQDTMHVAVILAMVCTVLINSFIGFIDDLLGWKIGLSKRMRVFLVIFSAIPLMVINAGDSSVSIPLIGAVNLGLFYTFLVIPLGIVGATTTFNFLAGYNGLEARQGILILGALAIASYFTGSGWLSVCLLCFIVSMIAFLFFNKNPSKVFPGNIFTYSIGGLIAVAAIAGNLEQFALFIFIPNILEVFLKLRGKLRVESFSKVNEDGSLSLRHEKICGLEHLAVKVISKMKGKAYEGEVVTLINVFQLLVIIIGFVIFRQGIFL